MQMPQMAKDVLMGGFIAPARVAVKSQLSPAGRPDGRKPFEETFS
jgi:hypothetical protein